MSIPRWKKRQHILRRHSHAKLHKAHKVAHVVYLSSALIDFAGFHIVAVASLLVVVGVAFALGDEIL